MQELELAPFREGIDLVPLTDKEDLFAILNQSAVIRVHDARKQLEIYEAGGIDGVDPNLYSSQEGVMRLAQLAQTHYGKLHEFGADIPQQSYVMGSGPTIYTVTEFIPSTPLDRRSFPLQLAYDRMVQPLFRYFEWLYDTQQPFALFDLVGIPGERAYHGEQFSLSDDGNRLFLHDTPPTVFPTSSAYVRREMIRELIQLWEFAGEMELNMSDEEFDLLQGDYLRVLGKLEDFKPVSHAQ